MKADGQGGGSARRRLPAPGGQHRRLVPLVDRLPTSTCPGGEHCWFELIVAAGLDRTTVRTEPFAVPRKRREAVIVSPSPDQHFAPGTPVPLIGGGYSPDVGRARLMMRSGSPTSMGGSAPAIIW